MVDGGRQHKKNKKNYVFSSVKARRRRNHQSVSVKRKNGKKRVSVLPDLGTVVMMFVRGGAECSFSQPRNEGSKSTLVHVWAR